MTQKKVLLLFIAIAALFAAAKPDGTIIKFGGVDKLFKMAKTETPSQASLAALEQIAVGHPEAVDPQLAVSVGIKPDDSWMRASDVRAHAMRRIGETGRQEAITFLSGLKAADFSSDTTGQIWPESQVALDEARFLNIDNRPQQIEYLEDLVRNTAGHVGGWAIDQLCSLGSLPSSPLIADAIRRMNPGPTGAEQIRFAEARIRVVMSDSDRVKALSSALRITTDADEFRMAQWAIEELVSINTPEADAVLDKYSAAISALPAHSKEHDTLFFLPDTIDQLRLRR